MKTSETIGKIAPALVAIQAELKAIAKEGRNPHFSSRFVTNDALIEEVRPIVAAHGCAIVQSARGAEGVTFYVSTTLVHVSGEWIEAGIPIPLAKNDPQGAGSGLTYGRRYSLSALLSISAEQDDDGNAATRAPKAKAAASDGRAHSRAAASDPVTATAVAQPEDVKVRGVRLGDMPLPKLREVLKWAQENDKDSLIESASLVINHKVADNDLKARQALKIDDDSLVKRAIAAEAKAQDTLPFA